MSPVYQAALRSWSIPPAASFAILWCALVYLRGWWLLRRAGVPFLPRWRAATFLLGLLSLWIALASPLDVLNGFVLTAHMLQHMLLMMVVPPLLLLGAPLIPMVRGLPIFAAREFAGPFLNYSGAKRVGQKITHPIVALLLMGVTMFFWHVPAAYELALHSSSWHEVEHACFLITSLLFWWPVVQPRPSRAQWPRWAMVPYLLVADLQNTILSAVLIFSDRVLYSSYGNTPRLFGFSALEDQVLAGSLMWLFGSLAFVIPAVVIAIQCLSTKTSAQEISYERTIAAFRSSDREAVSGRVRIDGPFGRRQFSTATLEVASFLLLFVVTGVVFASLLSFSTDDDDQTLRFRQISGPLSVAVFAPPGNLSAGSAKFSILVQDQSSNEVLLDPRVEVSGQSVGDRQALSPSTRASYEASDDKLLQSVDLHLPSPGDWTVNVVVRQNLRTAEFSFPVHVARDDPRDITLWPFFVFVVFAAGLFAIYLRRHRPLKTHVLPKCSAAAP